MESVALRYKDSEEQVQNFRRMKEDIKQQLAKIQAQRAQLPEEEDP